MADAKSLLSAKKWEEAVVVLRSEYRRDPESESTALDLARALIFSGRREEALNVLGQTINQLSGHKNSATRRALIQRTRVLSRMFLTNSTFQAYQDALNLMLASKYRAARERLERILEQERANVEILTRLGQCLALENDYDSAAENLRVARRLNPYEPDIQLWLGRSLHQRGELKEALSELRSAHQELPDSELAAVWYAEALSSTNQRATAIDVLEAQTRLHPVQVGALATLAKLRLASSSPRDSEAAWQVRKELQVALSRLPSYFAAEGTTALGTGGPLSVDPRRSESDAKKEINKLLAEAEARIEGSSR